MVGKVCVWAVLEPWSLFYATNLSLWDVMPARPYQKLMQPGCDLMVGTVSRIAPAFFPLVFVVFVFVCLGCSPNPHVYVLDSCCSSTSQIRYLADCLKSSSIALTSITLVSPSLPFIVSSIVSPVVPNSLQVAGRLLLDCMLEFSSESNKHADVWKKICCSKLSNDLLTSTCTNWQASNPRLVMRSDGKNDIELCHVVEVSSVRSWKLNVAMIDCPSNVHFGKRTNWWGFFVRWSMVGDPEQLMLTRSWFAFPIDFWQQKIHG